jgi:hypothetical protein
MKRLGREPEKLETLNLFSLLQSDDGSTLYDPANRKSFLSQIDSGLTRALGSEGTLHGIRVQSMFQGMVATLGYVRLLKEEDAGNCYYETNETILIPDFRIITTVGESWLIETKNHFSKDPTRRYRIRTADLRALNRYAEIVGTPLRLAIYWANLNQWTLNDPEWFRLNDNYSEIDFFQAMKENEMAKLGDYSIGTTYPITLKLIADIKQPRTVSADGRASMHIARVEMRSGNVLLDDKTEQNIAFYLMLYGKWEYDGGRVELDEAGAPVAMIHTSSPEEITPNQGFELIGSLSSLYSQQYNFLTLEGGRVSRLTVKDPTSLAPVIPRDLPKKQLPMWRFILQPNFE